MSENDKMANEVRKEFTPTGNTFRADKGKRTFTKKERIMPDTNKLADSLDQRDIDTLNKFKGNATKDDVIRDLMIEAEFGIKPGDTVYDVLLVDFPPVKHEIDQYFKTEKAARIEPLITQYGLQERIDELEYLNEDSGEQSLLKIRRRIREYKAKQENV